MKDKQLTETTPDIESPEEPENTLRDRIERLERESQESRYRSDQRVILAEMKVQAIRAGMIDLDGLKFLDMTKIHLEEDGDVPDGGELLSQLKASKPWLFAAPTSSSTARVPTSRPARQKLVKDMTDEEYRIARANIVKYAVL